MSGSGEHQFVDQNVDQDHNSMSVSEALLPEVPTKGALMPARCDAVAFDVLETLLDLDPLAERLEQVGQPRAALGSWFVRFQRDALALTLAGDFAAFTPVARQALRTETQHTISEADIEYVLEGFGELPAFPDAAPR
jgi:2-haloacid dehalogenase